MAVATVTLYPSAGQGTITGKYVCDASPSITNINLGFVPHTFEAWNATDGNAFYVWTADMPNDTCMKNTAGTQSKASSGGVTPVAQTDGTNFGVKIGTDAVVQVASKTFNFRASR